MPELHPGIAFERSISQEIFGQLKKCDEPSSISFLSSSAVIPLSAVKDIEISYNLWKGNDDTPLENSSEDCNPQTPSFLFSFCDYLR